MQPDEPDALSAEHSNLALPAEPEPTSNTNTRTNTGKLVNIPMKCVFQPCIYFSCAEILMESGKDVSPTVFLTAQRPNLALGATALRAWVLSCRHTRRRFRAHHPS